MQGEQAEERRGERNRESPQLIIEMDERWIDRETERIRGITQFYVHVSRVFDLSTKLYASVVTLFS